MIETPNANIPVSKKSEIYLPSNEEFVLFFDSENSLHLTGCKNILGIKTFYDYEDVSTFLNKFNVQTIGAVNVDTTIPFAQSAAQTIQVIVSGSNVAGTLSFSKVFIFGKTFTGATFTSVLGSATDFGTADITILSSNPTSIVIRAIGNAGETINFVVEYTLITK